MLKKFIAFTIICRDTIKPLSIVKQVICSNEIHF